MNAEITRVGIVGAGQRGRMFASVIAGIPGAEACAFADTLLAQSQATIEIRGRQVPVFASADEMFDAMSLDAVVLATPDFAHAAPAVAAAKRGIPMMLEKPVATSIEDTLLIRDAVRESGSICMVAFENRWNAPFVKIRNLVTSGSIGAPIHQSANLSNSVFVATKMLAWAAQSSPLWFLMPHTIDLVMWLGNSRIVSVMAHGTRGVLAARGVDTWDVVHVIATFENGSTATLTSSWVLPEGLPSVVDFTYELVGDKSSVRTEIGRSGIDHFADRHLSVGILDAELNGQETGAPAWMVRSFIESVMSGSPVKTTLDDGIAVNEVLFAIERSLETGLRESVERISE